MNFTTEARNRLVEYLNRPGYEIPRGIGTKDAACSVAAINLAIDGRLTDTVPECMSLVVGRWIQTVQDNMPDGIRNSGRWRAALPLAAGTGRDREAERLKLILDWMWEAVLPAVQDLADRMLFGTQWRTMCADRTVHAAEAAAGAAAAARDAADAIADAAAAAGAANAAIADAADAADAAANAAAGAADAIADAAEAIAAANAAEAYAAAYAAYAAADAIAATRDDDAAVAAAWTRFDPAGLLDRIAG